MVQGCPRARRRRGVQIWCVRVAMTCGAQLCSSPSASVPPIALYNDIPVGTVCCRFEFLSKTEVKLYIMTLGTLAPYRRLGIATKVCRFLFVRVTDRAGSRFTFLSCPQLLQHVMDVAGPGKSIELKDPNAPTPKPKKGKDGKEVKQEPVRKKYKVLSAYLHVQTSNEDAKAFYEKAGFAVKELLPEYHRPNVEPRSAWLLEKTS